MANAFTKKIKEITRYVWEMFKSSMLPSIMYCCGGWIVMVLSLRGEQITWTDTKLTWSIVCVAVAAVYQMITAWACGGGQYEMLASGNIKRASYSATGTEYRINSHKVAKEYRVWKGFVIGAMTSFLPAIILIILGCNQEAVHATELTKGTSVLLLIAIFFCGWAVIPFYCMNAAGIYVSYFVGLALCAIPIIVNGGMYIAGAYARRNKNARLRMLEDKAAEEEAARRANPKINYGGLPGTKPRKRK